MKDEGIRVGIIGTGGGLRTHMPTLLARHDTHVVGIVGSSLSNCRRHLSSAGQDPNLGCELEALLDMQPHLICLTSPPNERQSFADTLSSYQGFLLAEKPLGLSETDARRFATNIGLLAQRSYVNFQLRGLPAIGAVRTIIEEGAIGVPYHMSIEHHIYADKALMSNGWRGQRSTGGGQLFEIGTHLLDLAVFLTGGDYSRLTLTSASRSSPLAMDSASDSEHSTVEEEFEVSASIGNCRLNLFASCISYAPRSIIIRVDGTAGAIRFYYGLRDGYVRIFTARSSDEFFIDETGCLSEEFTHTRTDAFIFKVAFPPYLDALMYRIRGDAVNIPLATTQDGIQNAAFFDRANSTI